jgi:hypothetical protein
MVPRTIVTGAAISLVALVTDHSGLPPLTAAEQVVLTPAKPLRPVSFRDRLVVGLRARRPSEIAFVEAVVQRVHAGQLPQRIVDQTFFWARERAAVVRHGRSRRPIIYFRPAMIALAKRLKIDL